VGTTHTPRRGRTLVGVGALAVLAAIVAALLGASASKASAPAPHQINVQPQISGPQTLKPGTASFGCQGKPIDGSQGIVCYSPNQIQQAYGFSPLLHRGIDGTGRTIVIVDAFQDPYIQSDLATQDATFGLPAANLTVHVMPGTPPFDPTNADMVGWGGETTLDVEYAHAMAPGAHILLISAKSDYDTDLYAAEKWAVDNNAGDVMSQSFGENEACVDPTVFSAWQSLLRQATNQRWTVFASSGDSGAAQFNCAGTAPALAPGFPAVDPNVTGVGGTTLAADINGNYGSETAWTEGIFAGCNPPDDDDINCSGGGFSTIFPRPFYQPVSPAATGAQRYARGVPDVSYDAGVNGGVLARCSPCNIEYGLDPSLPYFFIFGGTSAGSPQWAALAADADQYGSHRMGNINPALYFMRGSALYNTAFHDVKTGNNTVADLGGEGYFAAKGWDPVTGLGSPNAKQLVPALAGVTLLLH